MNVPATLIPARPFAPATAVSGRLDLTSCRRWLDEAGRASASNTVGQLITDVRRELHALFDLGDDVASEMHDVVVGALESVAAAVEIDRTSSAR